jgi:hypothetical protein
LYRSGNTAPQQKRPKLAALDVSQVSTFAPLGGLQGPVIVAMIPMRMMEMTVNEVIGVIAMRDGLMPASWSMNMASFMPAAIMFAGAPVWVLG